MTEDSGSKARLLMVEDNPGDVELFRWALKRAGVNCDLLVLTDGGAALQFIRDQAASEVPSRPDLVILDLNLPKASGREILAAMRSAVVFAKVPVVILTSSNALADRAQLDVPEVIRYFVKPPDLRELLNLGDSIREVLAAPTGESSAGTAK